MSKAGLVEAKVERPAFSYLLLQYRFKSNLLAVSNILNCFSDLHTCSGLSSISRDSMENERAMLDPRSEEGKQGNE